MIDADKSPLDTTPSTAIGHAWALGAVAFVTLFASPWRPTLAPVNIVMLYLLIVVAIAYRFGRRPATTAAVTGVAAFDFFFVPPAFSFAVEDAQYLLTFAVMLATGLMIAALTERLKDSARQAGERERRAHRLYRLARELAGAFDERQIDEAGRDFVERSFEASASLLLPDGAGKLAAIAGTTTQGTDMQVDMRVANEVFARERPADASLPVVETGGLLYLPLLAPRRNRGVLVVAPVDVAALRDDETRASLKTSAMLIAIALERVHLVTVAREALLHMEGERLRGTLLSALSHDLRTPLTAILGSAEALRLPVSSGLPPVTAQHELIEAIHDQAQRTVLLVESILDMARLESGVRLRREWQPLEEIVGASLAARAAQLSAHRVEIDLPADLPLIECDATLLERVFVNLLENAARHAPAGSTIRIAARTADGRWRIDVIDEGLGIAPGEEARIFEKFERGADGVTRTSPGLGLGLAICRAAVEAHGGRISVERAATGGADFVITLPLGDPPPNPDETGDNIEGIK